MSNRWGVTLGAVAYFLTFSTYGVHLPGDERGSMDRHLGRLPAGVPALEDFATGIMNESPFRLAEPGDREAVLCSRISCSKWAIE